MSPRYLLIAAAAWASTGFAGAVEDASSAAKRAIESGPALGWVFPIFTDKEGYHMLTLRGSSAKMASADRIEVTGFSAFVFSGDAREKVDSVLMSPQATFFPKLNRAGGDSSVRLIHDDIEVTGRGWTYDHKAQKVTISHDVRVVFQAQLKDILK